MQLPYAEDVKTYWKTGRSSPESIIDDACEMIEGCGGRITQRISGRIDDREAFRIQFVLRDQTYVIVWPVLESKYADADKSDLLAARRQAATFIKHDIKAKCSVARVLGAERAFFEYVCLPDGRPIVQVALGNLTEEIPKLELRNE